MALATVHGRAYLVKEILGLYYSKGDKGSTMVMVMVMVNVDLYSAIITKVSNALTPIR